MKRHAFISVYDKVGLIDFARNLIENFDYELSSCGDTFDLLKESGIDVNQYKDFKESDIESFDMVVVNLCPFEKIADEYSDPDKIINNIDLNSFYMLRTAAKNYKNITVITDKIDYYVAMNANEFERLKLASKAFNITSNYDKQVCHKIAECIGDKPFKSFDFEKLNDFVYGENPHQKAAIYKTDKMVDYEVVHDKELSFNNILDVSVAVDIVSEFYDVNCVSIACNAKPCGVALGVSLYDAYTKAFDCDPISSFYGVVGFSKPVDLEVAKHLNSMSVKIVVAPDFEEDVIALFEDNDNIKLVKLNTPLKDYKKFHMEDVTITPFGALVQDYNNSELNKEMFKVVTKTKPTTEQIEDAVFAWKVVKYAKTNSIVISKDFKTSAIAQGYTNTMAGVEWALNYSCDNSKEAVLASDAALQSEDSIYSAAQGRISLIIQPGGTIKDSKLIELCDKYGIAMITTGIRNYKH